VRLPSSFDLLPAAFPFIGSLAFNDNYGAGGWRVGRGGSAYMKNLQHSPDFVLMKRRGYGSYLFVRRLFSVGSLY
jgi:hypothetical protein